jgi:murein DD-endopeptidase MepM/ murein hydrolase activator NlpD
MRIGRRTAVSFLLGALAVGTVWPTAVFADDAQQRLDQLKQQHEQTGQQINQLKGQETSLSNQIDTLNKQINDYNTQIQDLESQIQALDAKITALQADIDKTQKQLDRRNEMLKKRIRVMYEDGEVSYLDVLLQATDFSDFIDRLSALSFIVDQDKQLLEEVKQMKARLLDSQKQLKDQQALQQQKQAQLEAAKAEQELAKQQREIALSQVQAQRQEKEKAYQNEEQQIAAAEAEIAAAVAARIAAEQASGGGQSVPITSSGSWTWPVPSSHTITSGYGPRDGGFHKGIDIGAPLGTPIVAVDDGEVLFAGPASGFGHWIVIRHANGVMSVYGHMYSDGVLVSPGQYVHKGQVIGRVGSDGESSGPHLHFGVATGISGGRMNYVNPTPYL